MRVHAPYNFVPIADEVLIPYASVNELPSHNRLESDRISGEIRVRMTARTPVFISDGETGEDVSSENCRFFTLSDGTKAIPGSSLRGLVRENIQILGFGIFRNQEKESADLQLKRRIFFRSIADAKDSVKAKLHKHYLELVGNGAKNITAGYIQCNHGTYEIVPVRYQRLKKADGNLPDWLLTGETAACYKTVYYTETEDGIDLWEKPEKAGCKKGMVLVTGKPIGKKVGNFYLFHEADWTQAKIAVSEEDVLQYNSDLEMRSNSLKGARYDPGFWELPAEGESAKPIFYMTATDGLILMGMTHFLRAVYENTPEEGIPANHRQLDADGCIDYVCALFGYAHKDCSYKSRLSFGNLKAEGNPKELAGVQMILAEPKPSYFPGYLQDGKFYDQTGFHIRGYKQYWVKTEPDTIDPAELENRENVITTLYPLPKETVFRGSIRFKNLTRDELGLLLWALHLEKGALQPIGMGKPYGYGAMGLEIEALEYDEDSYTSFAYTPINHVQDIEELINSYKLTAAEQIRWEGSLEKKPEIADFLYMRTPDPNRPSEELRYMSLDIKNSQQTEPLLTVAQLRKAWKEEAPQRMAGKRAAEKKRQRETADMEEKKKWQARYDAAKNSGNLKEMIQIAQEGKKRGWI